VAGLTSALATLSLSFSLFAHTDLPLGQVVWTGTSFLYVAETQGKIERSDGTTFATLDQGGEEMRCAPQPAHYWPAGIYCHTPDNRILRFGPDGSGPTELARLPETAGSDGALAFDTVGRFGYALLAAGGGSASDGGAVYAVRRSGQVQKLGTYPGPGGADEIAIAPKKFGGASGALLLSIDVGGKSGRLLAFDRRGTTRVIIDALGDGFNPIAVLTTSRTGRVYITDTISRDVLFAPTAGMSGVLVGTELSGRFWLVRASGAGFTTAEVATNLTAPHYNLEGATFVP
jgi:hypothetical protein